jgi:predicted nucleotidyltransferase
MAQASTRTAARARRRQRLERVLDALRAYEPERVYLFGSWASDEQDERSDLDLVIIKDTAAPFFDRLREVSRLFPHDVGPVDALVYTPREFEAMRREGNAFAELIAEEGRLVYARQAEG